MAFPDVVFEGGDSHTAGRSVLTNATSPSVALRAILAASGITAPSTYIVDGVGGRSLAGTVAALAATTVPSTSPGVFLQESGNQDQAGQRTPLEFGATVEAWARAMYVRFTNPFLTHETATSFQRIGEQWRDWETTARWADWGYPNQAAAISYNAELIRRAALLANEGINIMVIRVAEFIAELISQIPGGYSAIEEPSNPYHFDGVGNVGIALLRLKAFRYNPRDLDISTVVTHTNTTTDASYKALLLNILDNFEAVA